MLNSYAICDLVDREVLKVYQTQVKDQAGNVLETRFTIDGELSIGGAALAASDPGDVVLLEMQTFGHDDKYVPAAVFLALQGGSPSQRPKGPT